MDTFRKSDFTDGSKPGSDPYDNPIPQYRKPAPWASREAKAHRANLIADFLASGAWDDKHPTEQTGDAIGKVLGRAALHRQEVDDPKKIATLVEHLLARPTHDWHDVSRPRLDCDTEERIAEWLDASGVGARLAEAGRAHVEARERMQLRALLDKYPDEVRP